MPVADPILSFTHFAARFRVRLKMVRRSVAETAHRLLVKNEANDDWSLY